MLLHLQVQLDAERAQEAQPRRRRGHRPGRRRQHGPGPSSHPTPTFERRLEAALAHTANEAGGGAHSAAASAAPPPNARDGHGPEAPLPAGLQASLLHGPTPAAIS